MSKRTERLRIWIYCIAGALPRSPMESGTIELCLTLFKPVRIGNLRLPMANEELQCEYGNDQ
ncbi:hypothetical protein FHX44_115980 [Pseudonocardia hierapolitana]|uniref:Uncharacterized protein n=1 Tax=Pseudonocardia hierapolitana TaxID=1128676 RepID=A0A561SYX8_9PSEU|nr:hypothetical protein FHX44_115980 [Pseudonocardia hierapolitana]